MTKRWYVVKTKSNSESTVVKSLINEGFKAYNPTYTREVPKKGYADRRMILPLFPSYVFVQFDFDNDRWYFINKLKGVLGIVGNTESFIPPVREGCIEELIARSDDTGNIQIETAVRQLIEFKEGMTFKLKSETYGGIIGTYCNHSEKRVTLLLTLLNRKIKVDLPIEAVVPT